MDDVIIVGSLDKKELEKIEKRFSGLRWQHN